jgi:hypothetical protein
VRVALLDPGSEGLALAATLRAAGFVVELAELSDITRLDHDVAVLAGDAPSALKALRALRDDGLRPGMPVVLVGAPPGSEPEVPGPNFGADWTVSRASMETSLVAAVHRVSSRGHRQSEGPGLREHTLDLGERSQVNARRDGEAFADPFDDRSDGGDREPGSGEIEVPGRKARTSDPAPVLSADSSSVDIAFDAPVSPALAELLSAADRRVFPHLPPTDPSLPRGESSARELVPQDLLYGPSSEPDEEPALDSLTFVGAVPEVRLDALPRTTGGTVGVLERALEGTRTPSRVLEGRGERKSLAPDALTPAPRRFSDRPRSIEALGDARGENQRTPSVARASTEPKEHIPAPRARAIPDQRGEGDLLAWIGALRECLVSGVVRLALQGIAPTTPEIVLTLRDGHVTSMQGPVASGVLAVLDGSAHDDRIDAEREAAAEAELERRRDAGLLSPLREASLRSAQRALLLRQVLAASKVRFAIGPDVGAPSTSRPFATGLAALLLEHAGSALHRDAATAILPERAEVSATGAYSLWARECSLAPALDALLGSARQTPLHVLLDAGWEDPSLSGVVVLLAALGALEVRSSSGLSKEPRDAASAASAAQWLQALAARADDGDYFAMLSLPRDASAADVQRAHAQLAARLEGLPLDALALGHLAPHREAAGRGLEEAHRVLSVQRWREAYRAAID